jgi:hypothetical protein
MRATVYVGGVFRDGGGLDISPTKEGGATLKRVAPREPVSERLRAVTSGVELAESVESADLKSQLMDFATQLAGDLLIAS